MRTHFHFPKAHSGSALIIVLFTVVLLGALSGAVLLNVLNKRATLNSSASWQESLVAAEAGAHRAVAQVAQALSFCTADSLANLPSGVQSFTVTLNHQGEGSSTSVANYTITPISQSFGSAPARTYYRIVSTGITPIAGRNILPNDFRDIALRKLLHSSAKGSASRKIEVILRPVYNTDAAIQTDNVLTLNNHNIYVDGFNSSSTSNRNLAGLPSPVMGQFNVAPYNIYDAHIATNGQYIQAGDSTIYGDALTDGGVVGNASNVLGLIRDDYHQDMIEIKAPTDWNVSKGVEVRGNGNNYSTVTTINKSVTLIGGTKSAPARYIFDAVRLAGAGDILTFNKGSSGTNNIDSSKIYIEMYVIGDFSTKGGGGSGDGSVIIMDGVQVKLFVGGNLAVGGNGIVNNNGRASALSIYGINPTGTNTQTFDFGGTSTFFGTVYASGADIKLAGGANGTYVGSIAGKTVFLNGNTNVRYDASIAGSGLITRFAIASWFEDVKK